MQVDGPNVGPTMFFGFLTNSLDSLSLRYSLEERTEGDFCPGVDLGGSPWLSAASLVLEDGGNLDLDDRCIYSTRLGLY